MKKKLILFLLLVCTISCGSLIHRNYIDLTSLVPLKTTKKETLSIYSSHTSKVPACLQKNTGYGVDQRLYTFTKCVYYLGETESLTLYFLSSRLFMSVHERDGEVFENKLQHVVDKIHNFNP